MHDSEYYSIEDAACLKQTPRAILIEADCLDSNMWIPQSQIHPDSEVWKEGDVGTLKVTQWLADQKGWR